MSRLTIMLETLPEGRRGRILALALAFMVVLLIWLVVIAPLAGIMAQRSARISLNRDTIARMTHLQDILPHLRQTASRLPGTTPGLIEGASDSIASASLQDHLARIAGSAGTEIGSSETLPPVTEKGARRIGLHITLLAPYPVLVRFLGAIEQASPAMIVDGLHLHAPDDGNTGGLMACDMSVYAYRRAPSPVALHPERTP